MQCPFCSRYDQTTLSQIDDEYIKSGKVRYVVKDYPLESLHANAFRAAHANHCAAEQGRAWDMYERQMANQQKLTAEDIIGYADAMGLDTRKFKDCLGSGKYVAEVRKQVAEGQSLGVKGTPTFFLGVSEPDSSQMKPQKMLTGAVAYSVFKTAIDESLAKK
jgi:protein-disulfide isomerase